MLPCQRDLFAMPREVAYLNAAAWAPIPLAARDAGIVGLAGKVEPWLHDRDAVAGVAERARAAAAHLIGAAADDVAIVGSVSHAIATAARNLPIAPRSRVLRVAGEFPSQVLAWTRAARTHGAVEDVVARPDDGDWTRAVLEAIDRAGASPLAVAALTPLHWTDGARIDLERIAPAVHRHGAALVIDATQAVGAMPIDARALGADFLAFPTYKWVLGPYSVAFLYAAPHRQTGESLEPNGFNEAAAGARRYDRGELTDPIALPIALAGLERVAAWGAAAVAERTAMLTARLAAAAEPLGIAVMPEKRRVPHIIGLRLPGGLPPDIIAWFAQAGVHVSDRDGALRVSPHVYNDEDDIDRCAGALSVLVCARNSPEGSR